MTYTLYPMAIAYRMSEEAIIILLLLLVTIISFYMCWPPHFLTNCSALPCIGVSGNFKHILQRDGSSRHETCMAQQSPMSNTRPKREKPSTNKQTNKQTKFQSYLHFFLPTKSKKKKKESITLFSFEFQFRIWSKRKEWWNLPLRILSTWPQQLRHQVQVMVILFFFLRRRPAPVPRGLLGCV